MDTAISTPSGVATPPADAGSSHVNDPSSTTSTPEQSGSEVVSNREGSAVAVRGGKEKKREKCKYTLFGLVGKKRSSQ
jgi:hypothetical protein